MAGDDDTDFAKRIALGHVPMHCTPEQAQALREWATLWLAFQTIGRAAGVLKSVVMWFGWAVAVWLAWRAGLIDWIKGVAK